MALLQISEPNQSKIKHEQRFAVGIDLGTTNSLIAAVMNNSTEVFLDEEDKALLPSVVQYKKNKVIVGEQAQAAATKDPYNTISSVKRLMGRSANEVNRLAGKLLYEFIGDENSMSKILTVAGAMSPVQVSAEILKVLKARAEKSTGKTIEGAVITVPAYFDDAQRQATKDAGKLAGLNVLRLLNEPTAAAVAYGLDRGEEGIHIIYDLGGGTFDLSILRLHKGIFEVIATGGDSALGGDDIDHVIAHWILQQAHWTEELSAKDQRHLLMFARQIKESLSIENKINIAWKTWRGELTRQQFDLLLVPILEKTLKICQNVLHDAKINLNEIQAIVLVGGATRIPLLREKVGELFKQSPLTDIDPDQVVAIGAAIQADILIGNQANKNLLLLDVLPLSLGLEMMGGLTEKIIERNTPIPVTRSQQFTTYKDGQTGMIIHVVQGERELVQDCRSLAKFELKDIPPMKAGAARIQVIFQVDADGLLNVSATELSTGVTVQVDIKPSYGLTDEEVSEMLKNAYAHAEVDMEARELKEKQVAASQLIEMLSNALAEDGKKYLSAAEEKKLREKMRELALINESQDRLAIMRVTEELDALSQTFAERRMEGNLKAALLGKNIEEV